MLPWGWDRLHIGGWWWPMIVRSSFNYYNAWLIIRIRIRIRIPKRTWSIIDWFNICG